jgi:hypothetical protein
MGVRKYLIFERIWERFNDSSLIDPQGNFKVPYTHSTNLLWNKHCNFVKVLANSIP